MWCSSALLVVALVLPLCVGRPALDNYGRHTVVNMEMETRISKNKVSNTDYVKHLMLHHNHGKDSDIDTLSIDYRHFPGDVHLKSSKSFQEGMRGAYTDDFNTKNHKINNDVLKVKNSFQVNSKVTKNVYDKSDVHQKSTYSSHLREKTSTERAHGKFIHSLYSLHRHIRKSGLTCKVCIVIFDVLQKLSETALSRSEIASEITKICIQFGVEDKRVCSGITHEFQDEVLTVLSKLALNSSFVCGQLLGPHCSASHNPFISWNVTIPKKPEKPTKPCQTQSSHKPLRVLQLSDIHLDLLYENGSNAECGEPLCCRKSDGVVKGEPAGYWGDYRNCDSPLWTVENLFQHLATQKFDYIMWTGDLPAHNIWEIKKSNQVKLLNLLTAMFKQYFPTTPVFSALGNHEGVPVNSFPPSTEHSESMSWLYSVLADNWSRWLPKTSLTTVKKAAYYDVLVKPGFRIVSLNMNYCNTLNFWLLLNLDDPDEELKWLVNTLLKAEQQAEKVHILGHIPPNQCLQSWSWNYYRIVSRFHDTIAAQFFGHTHRDQFLVFYDDVTFKQPISVAFVAPSVTTYPGQNPAYRVYEMEADYPASCKAVFNHENYILNLTEANRCGKANWQHEYSAKEAYGLSTLSPSEWNTAVQEMQKNHTAIQQYYRYYYKSHPPTESCDAKCAAGLLCEIMEARSFDSSLCSNITNGHNEYMKLLSENQYTC